MQHSLSTTRDNTTHGHHQMVNIENRLIIFFAAEAEEALYSQQKQVWELTGSDHKLLIAKFRLKLKKVGKSTWPLRYDLNQNPMIIQVEVTNIFKGLDPVDRMTEEQWTDVRNIIQEVVIKIVPKKNKCKKAKRLPEEALQIAEKRREVKDKGERERRMQSSKE